MGKKNKNKLTLRKGLLEPWTVIPDNKLIFFVWFMFTILASQIGIIINLIIRVLNGELSFIQSIYLESINGSFYTFSIVLIASLLSPLFINFVENSPTHFKSIKIVLITILIFALFFAGIFYSTSITNSYDIGTLSNLDYSVDICQLIFFVIAIILALYTFNVSRLDLKKHKALNDDYGEMDDEGVKALSNKAENITTDNKGNKI